MSKPHLKAATWPNTAMFVLLIASVFLNLVFVQRIKGSQRAIEMLKAENRLKPGATVPNIEGEAPDGKPITIRFSERPTILYVFTPDCHWCQRNLANMLALSHAVAEKYAFVGVSLNQNGVAEYMQQHGIEYPVVTNISESIKLRYKMSGTPTTILVSPDNKVIKAWTGVYDGRLQEELEGYFQVKLPGLASAKDQVAKK